MGMNGTTVQMNNLYNDLQEIRKETCAAMNERCRTGPFLFFIAQYP